MSDPLRTSTQNTHTPGPWRVEYDGPSLPIVSARRDTVALVRTNEVDANLIAAAPDLLVALKEMREACAAAMRVIVYADMALNTDFAEQFAHEVRSAGISDGFGVRAQDAVSKAEGTTRHVQA